MTLTFDPRKLAAVRLWGATRFPYLASALFATHIVPINQRGVIAPAAATQLRRQAVRWERRAGGDSVPVAAECLLFKEDHAWRLAWC